MTYERLNSVWSTRPAAGGARGRRHRARQVRAGAGRRRGARGAGRLHAHRRAVRRRRHRALRRSRRADPGARRSAGSGQADRAAAARRRCVRARRHRHAPRLRLRPRGRRRASSTQGCRPTHRCASFRDASSPARSTRFAHALDLSTRTMLTEVDLDNPTTSSTRACTPTSRSSSSGIANALQAPGHGGRGRQASAASCTSSRDGQLAKVPVTTGIADAGDGRDHLRPRRARSDVVTNIEPGPDRGREGASRSPPETSPRGERRLTCVRSAHRLGCLLVVSCCCRVATGRARRRAPDRAGREADARARDHLALEHHPARMAAQAEAGAAGERIGEARVVAAAAGLRCRPSTCAAPTTASATRRTSGAPGLPRAPTTRTPCEPAHRDLRQLPGRHLRLSSTSSTSAGRAASSSNATPRPTPRTRAAAARPARPRLPGLEEPTSTSSPPRRSSRSSRRRSPSAPSTCTRRR